MTTNILNFVNKYRGIALLFISVLLLNACGGGDTTDDDSVVQGPTVSPAPTLVLSTNLTSVTSGESALLNWSSTDATSCTASGAWSGSKPTSGSASTGGLTDATNTFTLSCTGPGGTVNKSVEVMVSTAPPPLPTVTINANPTSVASGEAAMLSWSSTDATSCTASGAWSGSKPTSGSASTGGLVDATNTFTLSCTGPGGTASQSASITVSTATAPSLPTVTINANPTSVASGEAAMLTWSSTDATSCTASDAWSGSKPTSGSASTGGLVDATNTFTLSCTGPGGTASQSATVTASDSGAIYGLDFQGSAATANTVRFKFTNPLAPYPATYIWKVKPRQQSGYYTAFFWGNDDGQGNLNTFLWTSSGGADTYYGAHPYPDNPPNGNTHKWEISIEQRDYVNGAVVYDRWHTQVLRVWADENGKHHEFYWDFPNTDPSHMVIRTAPTSWGNTYPPSPALTWGDAPWNPGNEVWNGVMRGIQVYSTNLSLADIMSEIDSPLSTAAGAANVWYLNTDPTPTDISDKSSAGHNPEWVGSERPLLWMGP